MHFCVGFISFLNTSNESKANRHYWTRTSRQWSGEEGRHSPSLFAYRSASNVLTVTHHHVSYTQFNSWMQFCFSVAALAKCMKMQWKWIWEQRLKENRLNVNKLSACRLAGLNSAPHCCEARCSPSKWIKSIFPKTSSRAPHVSADRLSDGPKCSSPPAPVQMLPAAHSISVPTRKFNYEAAEQERGEE